MSTISRSSIDFASENPASPTETGEDHTPPHPMAMDEGMRQLLAKDGHDSDVSDLSDTDNDLQNAIPKKNGITYPPLDPATATNRRSSVPTTQPPTLGTKSRPEVPIPPPNDLFRELSHDHESESTPRLPLINNLSDSLLLSKKKRQLKNDQATSSTMKRRRSSITMRKRRRSSIVNVSLSHRIVFRPEPIVRIHNHLHELKLISRLDAWMCAGCGAEKRRTDPRFRCSICPNVSVCDREACKEAHNLASVSTVEIVEFEDGRKEIVTPLNQSNKNHDGVDPELLRDHRNLQYVTMSETGEYTCSMCRMTFSEKDDYNRYRCSTCDDFDACATCVWKNLYHINGGPWLNKLLTVTDVTGKTQPTCPPGHTCNHDLHLVNREYVGGSSGRRHLLRQANRARFARMRGAGGHGGGGPGGPGGGPVPPTGGPIGPPGFGGGAAVMIGPPVATTGPAGAVVPGGGATMFGAGGFGFGAGMFGGGATADATLGSDPRNGGGPTAPDGDGVVDGSLERMQDIFSQIGEQTSSLTSTALQWAQSLMADDQKDDGADDSSSLLTNFQFPPPANELERNVAAARQSDSLSQQDGNPIDLNGDINPSDPSPPSPTPDNILSLDDDENGNGTEPVPLGGLDDRRMNDSMWGNGNHLPAVPGGGSGGFGMPPVPPPSAIGRSMTEPITRGDGTGDAYFPPSQTPPPHLGNLTGPGTASYLTLSYDDNGNPEQTPPAVLNARSTAAAGVTDWVCGVCQADKEHEDTRHRCGTCENFDVCDRLSCLVSHAHPLKVVPYDAEFKSSCAKCCRSNVTNRWLCHSCEGDVSFCHKCIRKALKIANALSDWTGTDWDAATDFVHDCLDSSPHSVPQHRTFTYWSYKYCIMEDEDLRSRLVRLVERGIEHRQTTLHVLWVFLCSTSLPKTSLARVRISEEINAVCRTMMGRRRGEFTSSERNFVKFCLAFCYPTRYGPLFDELQATAREVLDELTRPLIQMYEDMVHRSSPLITIHDTLQEAHMNQHVKAQQDILPQQMIDELMEWYDHEKIDDMKATKAKDFCEKWEFHWERVLKLRMKDGKFHAGRITLNMFKEIAEELQHSFQNVIARIFEENRSRLNMSLVSEDYDVGPRAPEPKTISRAQHKSFREFSNRPNPREGYILDFLRAAVVCESEEEALGFFEICVEEAFHGQIVHVSNGFDRDAPTNFGYRALHLNVIFESPSLARARLGRKMIMEIQIILRDFLRIRKKMHLYNKIVRAREQWAIGRDFSKMWDL